MGKLKKPPKNAYYFFMVDRKAELERAGFRFPGGLKDVAGTVRSEWNEMAPEAKVYFEDLAKKAKEEEKYNLDNKFTATGESYAHVLERQRYEESLLNDMERYLDDLTVASETPPENRNFIVIKTIHSCEILIPNHAFWPLELTIAAFNLKDGMKSHYWTLVDTVTVPVGFASAAKDTAEETGLPIAGQSRHFEEKHRDYKRIMVNIQKFVEKFLENYGSRYVLFCMEPDMKSAEGCLNWLFERATASFGPGQESRDMKAFMDKLILLKLPKLLLKFAIMAKRANPNYNHVMACYNNLERSAALVLSEGCFDYRDDITCDYHNGEEASIKMNVCARNVALRQIYLILKEIVPAMLLEMKDGHNIETFKRFSKRSAPVAPRGPPIPGPPSGTPRESYSNSAVRPRPTNFNPAQESASLAHVWGSPLTQPLVVNPNESPEAMNAAWPLPQSSRSTTRPNYQQRTNAQDQDQESDVLSSAWGK